MATAPFPVQPYLTAIAIAYRNPVLIADEVLPRVPVGVQDFKYLKHNLADGFTIPDTKVGRRAKPNEVEFQATETSAST
ncbi:MAG: phage capsid protein, partial [Thermoleophilaceae bacterium]